MSTPYLFFEIHLDSGEVDRFEANSPEQAKTLGDQLAPSKVFSTPTLILVENDCLTTYQTKSIVRIDVSGKHVPNWPYLGNAVSVRQVTDENFLILAGSEQLTRDREQAAREPGTRQEGFTELVLSNDERIIWQVNVSSKLMVAADSLTASKSLLSAGGLHGESITGAIMILNVAHIVRLSFYPGPPDKHPRLAFVTRV